VVWLIKLSLKHAWLVFAEYELCLQTAVSSFSSMVNLDCPVDLRFSRNPWILVLSAASNLASLRVPPTNTHTHTHIISVGVENNYYYYM